MNCLILLALLLCCGNNCGRSCCGNQREDENSCGCGNRREQENNCGCGNGRGRKDSREENEGCGCRQDNRPEPRLEPRSFTSFSGQGTCGCEGPRDNND